jgi:hypothetical protein
MVLLVARYKEIQKYVEVRGSKSSMTHHADNVLRGDDATIDDPAAEMAFAFAGLVRVEMAFAGLRSFEQARGGDTETLLGTLVRFHLWHKTTSPTACLEQGRLDDRRGKNEKSGHGERSRRGPVGFTEIGICRPYPTHCSEKNRFVQVNF